MSEVTAASSTRSDETLASWFQARPKWLQEAARRLYVSGTLADTDITELAVLCKREAKIDVDGFEQLGYGAFPDNAFAEVRSNSRLSILSIDGVEGINALDPRAPLAFSPEGLTIVYGSNGAGKSGYLRILKHTCGAKALGPLHPNVFSDRPIPAACRIKYRVDDRESEHDWGNGPTCAALGSVCIYDTACGQIYVDDEHGVTYEPQQLSFLRRLGECCQAVVALIQAEAQRIVSRKLAFPGDFRGT